MTHIQIDDTSPRIAYVANAAQVIFIVPFAFFDDADLIVSVNGTVLTLTTNYTVAGEGDTGGGTVTLVTPSTVNDQVVIVREIAIERVTDFPASGPFELDDLNTELDRQVAMIQQIDESSPRSIQQPPADVVDFVVLPIASLRANKYLFFDSAGQPSVVVSVSTSVAASPFMLTLLDDTTAAQARATLGITNQTGYVGAFCFLAYR
jgi:hypothetical protein